MIVVGGAAGASADVPIGRAADSGGVVGVCAAATIAIATDSARDAALEVVAFMETP